MRKNRWMNSQDICNWYKTPMEMDFTEEGFPILKKNKIEVPRKGLKLIPFNYAKSMSKGTDGWVHFFIQDYSFNRIWNKPQMYIDILKKYKGIVMPDFSFFYDMPKVMQQWQYYKNLWFARMCQMQGIKVIPQVNYNDEVSWEWCFKGLPKKSVIMMSMVGAVRNKNKGQVKNTYDGAREMINQLQPKMIILRTTRNTYEQVKNKIGYEDYVEYRWANYTT